MSSGNWYQKERGKAALADELRKLGWTIHGYTEDRSDARSDYYAPASWHGVATKDGAILVVDIDYGFDGQQVVGKRVYTTTHYLQEFGVTWQANPPRKNWHVERDGKIVASGNGIGSIDSFKSGEAALKRILFDIERAVRQQPVTTNETGNAGCDPTMVGTVSVSRNAAKGGIEIKFSAKPTDEIISRLHAAGFRFSYRQSLWYGKDTPDRWEAAMRIYHAAMLRDTAEVAPPIVPEIVIVHDIPAPDPEPDNAPAPVDPAPAAAAEPAPMTWETRVLAAASANPDLLKVKPRKKQQPTAMEALPLFSFCAEPEPSELETELETELESELEAEPEMAPPAVIATADDEVEVIYTYSHQQAVEDGMLIDVTHVARGMGFDVPVFVTTTVWAEAICPDGENGGNRVALFLAYVKGILRNLHEEDALEDDLIELPMTLPMVGVHVVDREGKEIEPEERTLWLHLGANDEGEPIFKIMFPEDW